MGKNKQHHSGIMDSKEELLRQSEERLRLFISVSSNMVYRMNADWTRMENLVGKELLADTTQPTTNWIDKYILPEDQEQVLSAIHDAIAKKGIFELEHRVKFADGLVGWVHSRAIPLLNEKGEIKEWFGAGTDITEHRIAENTYQNNAIQQRSRLEQNAKEQTREIKAGRELLQAAIDSTLDIIQVFEAVRDENNHIIDFTWVMNNAKGIEQNGNVVGQKLLAKHPGVISTGIFDKMVKVVETGKTIEHEQYYHHEQFDDWFYQALVKSGDGLVMTTRNITQQKKAEQEIKENRALLQSIVDVSHSAISHYKAIRNENNEVVDFEWVVQNKIHRDYNHGKNLVGMRCLDIHPGLKVTGAFDRYVKVLETGIADEFEIHYEHENYDSWYRVVIVKLGDGLVTSSEDITQRKKAELEIHRLKDEVAQKVSDKYYSIFNSIDEGFCVYELIYDDKGNTIDLKWIEVNPAYEKQTGLKDVVGKTHRELALNTESFWLERYDNVLKTGESFHFEGWHQPTGRWYSTFSSRIGNAGSKQVAVVFSDITERKVHEKRQEYLLKLNDTLRTASDAIEIEEKATSVAMEYFAADRCYYNSIEGPNAIVRRDARKENLMSVAGTYQLNEYPLLKKAIEDGAPFIVTDIRTEKTLDQTLKDLCLQFGIVSFVNVPIIKNGIAKGVLTLIQSEPRNWTEVEIHSAVETAERTWSAVERAGAEEALRRNEQQLKVLLKTREDFIAIASHELKTPITSMKTYAEIARVNLQKNEDTVNSNILGKLNKQIDRLTALINDLLDTTKMAEGKLQLTLSPFNLNELLHETIDEISKTCTHKFQFKTESLQTVLGDRERIRQVISNLLSNAIKYSHRGTNICLSAMNVEKGVKITVSDEGFGIPEEEQKKIFDRFYRVSSNQLNTYPGVGLGLYISMQIVQRHGGAMEVQSTPGKGSTFAFTLQSADSAP